MFLIFDHYKIINEIIRNWEALSDGDPWTVEGMIFRLYVSRISLDILLDRFSVDWYVARATGGALPQRAKGKYVLRWNRRCLGFVCSVVTDSLCSVGYFAMSHWCQVALSEETVLNGT